jgi:hypothetical protein
MSAQRTVPPARAALRRLAALLLVAASLSACRTPGPHVIASRTAPDAHHVGVVRLERCGNAWCESLWVGSTPDSLRRIVTLAQNSERCTEISWTRDGKRVAFLINGSQLRLYNADSEAPAGLVDLVPNDSQPTTRIARGVTFSENGAAVTFDDCPRERSGCRPGIVAIR